MFFSKKSTTAPRTAITTTQNLTIGQTIAVLIEEDYITGTVTGATATTVTVTAHGETVTYSKAPAGTNNAGHFVAKGHENYVLANKVARINR